jgi:hypothetical protein
MTLLIEHRRSRSCSEANFMLAGRVLWSRNATLPAVALVVAGMPGSPSAAIMVADRQLLPCSLA